MAQEPLPIIAASIVYDARYGASRGSEIVRSLPCQRAPAEIIEQTILTWISQTYRCIGVENLRKMLCCNSFSEVQESPDADRLYAEAV